jgi:hypothetical protein
MSQYSQLRRAGLPSIFVYDVPDNLPLVNVTAGTIAFIESISGLFIYSNGWRPLDTSSDGPVISVAPLSISVESGTEYTTTIEASDPDGLPVVYSITTTGNVAENTEVSIDGDTGVLTVLSNNPYNDNFSIILTVSDGVFATTRTIPVTIENRLPVFTVEPAEAITGNVGTEFSYQYTVTDPDDSTSLTYTIDEILSPAFPNFQPLQTIYSNNAFDNRGYSFYSSTGGNYLALLPSTEELGSGRIRDGIYIYKYDQTDNKFKLFQKNITVQNPVDSNNNSELSPSAINNEFFFVTEYSTLTSTRTGKIMKYDEITDQFIDWAGGTLGSEVDAGNSFRGSSATFCKTSNNETALIMGMNGGGGNDIIVWVYDSQSDTWILKVTEIYSNDNTLLIATGGNVIDKSVVVFAANQLNVNPWREYEIATHDDREGGTTAVFELNLIGEDQGSVTANSYALVPQVVAAGTNAAHGLAKSIEPNDNSGWNPVGTFFTDENTLWCAHYDGTLFKVTRGNTLDSANGSAWLSGDNYPSPATPSVSLAGYTGGSAVIKKYAPTSAAYTPSLSAMVNAIKYLDRLVVNGNIGSLGSYKFIIDDEASTVQYVDEFDTTSYPMSVFERPGAGVNQQAVCLFNRDNGLLIYVDNKSIPGGLVRTYTVGLDSSVDANGVVSGKVKSIGTYNITTSVSDSIDTISDVVSLQVPAGVNFTQNPPSTLTISGDNTATFDTDVIGNNYGAQTPRIKFSSNIPHALKGSISGATSMAVKGNDLIALVGDEVRVYNINELGELSSSYSVINTDAVTNSYSKITNIYATEDYLILGRENNTGDADLTIGRVTLTDDVVRRDYDIYRSASRSYENYADTNWYYFADLHQNDLDATQFIEFSYRAGVSGGNQEYDSLLLSIKKYDPINNTVSTVATRAVAPSIDTDEYNRPKFFRSHHRDYQGAAGTGIIWLMWHETYPEGAEVIKLTYTNNSISFVSSSRTTSGIGIGNHGPSYDQGHHPAASSSDGTWFATGYDYRQLYVSNGTIAKRFSAAEGQDVNFKQVGFVKISGVYHLVTTTKISSAVYRVELWDFDPADLSPNGTITLLDSYSTTNINDSYKILGPIASDDDNNIIVGLTRFSVNVLSKTLTRESNNIGAASTGLYEYTSLYTGSNMQRLEYDSTLSLWLVYPGLTMPAGDDIQQSQNSTISAFSLNPITKVITLVESADPHTLSQQDSYTGVNSKGQFFTSEQSSKSSTSTLAATYRQWYYYGHRYHRGSIFGAGALEFYDNDYNHHSSLQFPSSVSNPGFGNLAGGILQNTGATSDDTYLVIGQPWITPQGGMSSYIFNSDTSEWSLHSSLTSHNQWTEAEVTNNNFGHSLAKFGNIILEAGPRLIDAAGYAVDWNDHVTVLGNRDGELRRDYIFAERQTNGELDEIIDQSRRGFAQRVFAKSYMAWASPENVTVFNSASNNPTKSIQETIKQSPQVFTTTDYHLLLPPVAFTGSLRSSDDSRYGLFLTDPETDRALLFEPPGDFTIEFHYRCSDTIGSVSSIITAEQFTNNFSVAGKGFGIRILGGRLEFHDNYYQPSTFRGVKWLDVAPNDGVWRHYAIVYNSVEETHTLWVNGIKISQQASTVVSNPKIWNSVTPTSSSPTYNWTLLGTTERQAGDQVFDIANFIITYDAQYDTNDNQIDISVYSKLLPDKDLTNAWLAIGINGLIEYSRNHNVENDGISLSGTPSTYTPSNITTSGWGRHISGNDNMLATASTGSLFIFARDVHNKFNIEQPINISGIEDISVLDNEADSVILLTNTGVKVYSRDISNYFKNSTSLSSGAVVLYPNLLTSGNYTLKSIATDGVDVRIKDTAITQNAVFDYSSVVDKDIAVEWGNTDVQTLPVSDTFDTTWHYAFTDSTESLSQIELSESSDGYELTVAPDTITHDKFVIDLDVEVGNERVAVATLTYNTYSNWKLGPFDGGDLRGSAVVNRKIPNLNGNEEADQSYYYGYALDMSDQDVPGSTSGSYVVVGQPRSNWDNTDAMTETGEVYVYQLQLDGGNTVWNQVQRIQDTYVPGLAANAAGKAFGHAVSITPDGNTLVIGAPTIAYGSVDPEVSGQNHSAAVYTKNATGTFVKIQNIDFRDIYNITGKLGLRCEISDDASTIVFSDYNYASNNGIVAVFKKAGSSYNSFQLIDHITSNWSDGSLTGQDLAISGDGSVIAIGQPNPTGEGSVLVYKYTNGGYQLAATLFGNDNNNNGFEFGYSVDMTPDGETIVVGSPGFNADRGTVYTFTGNVNDGYTRDYILAPNDEFYAAGQRTGHSVSIDKFASTIIAGAPYHGPDGRPAEFDITGEVGRVITFYNNAGTWTYANSYIPTGLRNNIKNTDVGLWYARQFGSNAVIAPSGYQCVVGDFITEEISILSPSKVNLNSEILNSAYNFTTDYSTGILESGNITAGGTTIEIELPDLWPTGIDSVQNYTIGDTTNVDGIIVSASIVNRTLTISHTSDASGSSTIEILPPAAVRQGLTLNSTIIKLNWV